jgi:ABC-type antimicrobial peptide transport system permease subunit
VHLVHINELAIGRFRGVLIILFISVSFLLMLACVNVAILLLARGEARQTEIALRKALGAGRRRIVGQLLTESLLLSLAGGGCGVLLALAGIRIVRHFIVILPALFPQEAEIALNVPVLLFSIGVSVATGVVCGLWPALRASRIDVRQVADAGSHKLAGRKGTRNSHMALLAAQAAITVLLLACSGQRSRGYRG